MNFGECHKLKGIRNKKNGFKYQLCSLRACSVYKFDVISRREATSGVKSTMEVTVTLGENTEDKLLGELTTAIIPNPANDTDREVTGTDVKR